MLLKKYRCENLPKIALHIFFNQEKASVFIRYFVFLTAYTRQIEGNKGNLKILPQLTPSPRRKLSWSRFTTHIEKLLRHIPNIPSFACNKQDRLLSSHDNAVVNWHGTSR